MRSRTPASGSAFQNLIKLQTIWCATWLAAASMSTRATVRSSHAAAAGSRSVVSLLVQYAVPGGLIGVGTKIDPTLTRADRLVGQVLGHTGCLPDVYTEVEISFYLLRRLLGVKTSDGGKKAKVQKLQAGEILMVNIGSTSSGGKVRAVKNELAKIVLHQPVCTQEGEKIALSRRVDKHWRLIGWGEIRKGSKIPDS